MNSPGSVWSWTLPRAFSSTFLNPIITLETGYGAHQKATRNERLNKDVLLTARSSVFPASRFKTVLSSSRCLSLISRPSSVGTRDHMSWLLHAIELHVGN
jgi:hypothetical protein